MARGRVIAALAVASIGATTAFAPSPGRSIISPSQFKSTGFVVSQQEYVHNAATSATKLFMSTPAASPMDRLSDGVIKAISYSQDASVNVGLNTLESEMLLVGMVRSAGANDIEARKILTSFGISPDGALKAAESIIMEMFIELPFSPAVKKALSDSVAIAERMSPGVGSIEEDYEDSPVARAFDGTQFCRNLASDMQNKVVTKGVIEVGGNAGGSTPTLEKVGIDLTEMAKEDVGCSYGRENEIRMCLRTLGRRRKSNPCLIGEAGVGKTAIAEGVAQVLAGGYYVFDDKGENGGGWGLRNPFRNKEKESEKTVAGMSQEEVDKLPPLPPCPRALQGFRVVSVDMASLIAGMKFRGDFEERIQKLIQEASSTPTILFIDELHTLIGAGGGGGEGGMNAANLMKPALARGEIRVIGATTIAEYRQYIEKDGALERRFQPIMVNEPSVDEAIEILNAVSPRYEEFHGVRYTPFAIDAAARLAERYVADRFLPDKAIDLIDEAGSMIKLEDDGEQDDLPEDFFVVTEENIATVVSEISGIPVGKLDRDEKAKLIRLEQDISDRVKGQDSAVRSVSKAIRRARSGLRDQTKPVATFMFILDEGSLTDGKGRTVSFKHCIFVMTSNVGSKEIIKISRGENPTAEDGSSAGMTMEGAVKNELEKKMKPELLNRIDEIVVFKPLEDDGNSRRNRGTGFSEQDMDVTVTPTLTAMVTREGAFSAAQFGARPMRRAAKRYLEDTLSEAIMREFLNEGDEVVVDMASEAEASGFSGDGRKIVKVTRVTNGRDSMLIPVDSEAGIGSIESNAMDALSRPMPPLPDVDGFM
ncbi:ATP-dependent Clp protease ATP-binding subunit ClpA [Skeletonema marinoi]|uniref:ATP-dependent Clp protease ATP-binding subunit ClpA n=1 Tax=Skeletonema marinoi TaxID=267567 RepID=A0AAD8YGU0_9STRA|nr:ATP-dependent Clp protease ATP-binding subunit ClpA [Skeletonema marinoi]